MISALEGLQAREQDESKPARVMRGQRKSDSLGKPGEVRADISRLCWGLEELGAILLGRVWSS